MPHSCVFEVGTKPVTQTPQAAVTSNVAAPCTGGANAAATCCAFYALRLG
ncbi:hypothetical protein HT118_17835 [Escherichia coli]|nr:hypothetical protein [Escherichia coli]